MKHLALLAVFLALPLCAQEFPDYVIGGGAQFNQASQPQSQGLAFFAKATDKAKGIYSYTLFRVTSVTVDTKAHTIAIQKQAETGFAFYLRSLTIGSLGRWDCFTAVTGGGAGADGSAGISASGTIIASHPIGRGWSVDVFAGPSYSAVANGGGSAGVSYPVGAAIHWGGNL